MYTFTGFGQLAQAILGEVEGGLAELEEGESRDVSATDYIKFSPLNPNNVLSRHVTVVNPTYAQL